ncbi:hypothetical protein [Cloacibacillus evryensis]|uniref:hypothetical protein n=1 Tax=Cloacibacillus evryensis TaxID=508460 RepID=UPI002B2077BD|nr:hypothetical protein [Cloacibacillus evryensis]MEA5034235.1 hypothetical protein [Cloacibacillus evryensis]
MIKAADLIMGTRMAAGDMQKTKYSDYELLYAVNAAITLLAQKLVKYFSPELRREGTAPADALALDDDNYYYAHPGKVNARTDETALSGSFYDTLCLIGASILRAEYDAADARADYAAKAGAGRETAALADLEMWK